MAQMANWPRIQRKASRKPGQGPKVLRDHATTGVSRSSDRGSQVGRWAPMSPHSARTCRTWSEELGGCAPGSEVHSGRYCTHCHSSRQSPVASLLSSNLPGRSILCLRSHGGPRVPLSDSCSPFSQRCAILFLGPSSSDLGAAGFILSTLPAGRWPFMMSSVYNLISRIVHQAYHI